MKVNIENEYVRGYKDGEKEWKQEHDDLRDLSQRMADALEEIENTASMDGYVLKKIAHKALQQFKDGKEVGDDK